jgi:hypothetical protein
MPEPAAPHPSTTRTGRAYVGTTQAVLTRAARSLLSVLTRQPLTYSPAVAATASRLRRLLDPIAGPASPEADPRTHHRPERLVPIGLRHAAMDGPADHSERPLAIAPGYPLQLLVAGRGPSGRSCPASASESARKEPAKEASGMQSAGIERAWRPRGDTGRRSWLAAQQRRRRRKAGLKRRR